MSGWHCQPLVTLNVGFIVDTAGIKLWNKRYSIYLHLYTFWWFAYALCSIRVGRGPCCAWTCSRCHKQSQRSIAQCRRCPTSCPATIEARFDFVDKSWLLSAMPLNLADTNVLTGVHEFQASFGVFSWGSLFTEVGPSETRTHRKHDFSTRQSLWPIWGF